MIANQVITIFLIFDFMRFVGLWILVPIIIIEPFILENYSKKSLWELFKFCVVINFISLFAGILLSFFASHLNAIPLYWVALITVIIWVENIIYQKHWKVVRKRKLLLTLIIINLVTYTIFTVPFAIIYSRHVEHKYINRLRCTNKLKKIGIGLIMYADDYKGFLPNKAGCKGFEQLRSNCYRSYDNVYQCPSCNPSPVQPCSVSQAKKQKLTKENVDYIYRYGLKLGDDKKTDYSKIPVVWDKPTNHENYGNVLFLDGQVKGFEGKNWMEQAGIKKTVTRQEK